MSRVDAADPVRAVAQAVLYEGYLLWPYRRSAPKNRQRWTFGGVFPRGWSEAGHPDDAWRIRTECLLEGDGDTTVTVTVRFLQIVERTLRDAAGRSVDRLTVEGEEYVAWQEATEREIALEPLPVDGGGGRAEIEIPASSEQDAPIVRSWQRLSGSVTVAAEAAAERAWRLRVAIENTTPYKDAGERAAAQIHSFASTHTVLRASGGAFVSLADPPERLARQAASCVNVGAWPVLVGESGARDTMLAAPIILPDYPQVAPESPGDLFDATEIDRLLILNTLSLTPEEQREMRASDPRAREILERCTSLGREELMRLHQGAIRELRVLREP
jgi:hypothetical protein